MIGCLKVVLDTVEQNWLAALKRHTQVREDKAEKKER